MRDEIDEKALNRLMRIKDTHYLLEHVSVGGKRECWPWTGVADKDGYGWVSGERAPRVMYAISRRLPMPFPVGLVIRHTCDNPPCCNPWHLERGSQLDNVADRVDRKRSASGPRNGRTKLTPEQVIEIRSRRKQGPRPLARLFGVDNTTIRDILNGKIWTDDIYFPEETLRRRDLREPPQTAPK